MDTRSARHIFFQVYERITESTGAQPETSTVEACVRNKKLFTEEEIVEGRKAFEQGIARIRKNAKRHQNLLRNQQKRFLDKGDE